MTMTSNADCKKGLCHYDSASRTKFFNGMLLTDEHLLAEQRYHREALKRMNRYMWGAGIVCGLKVEKVGGFCIKVHPGFALDCEGNAIELCQCITIDVSDVCKKKYPDGCAPQGAAPIKKCLLIRYKELDDETVPVLTPGDDCSTPDGRPRSQASRVREGFCLEFSDTCPDTTCEDPRNDLSGLFWQTYATAQDQTMYAAAEEDRCMSRTPECPKCECACDDSGICLANLTIDCDRREVEVKGDCRTYVWTPRYVRSLAQRARTQERQWQALAEKRHDEELRKLKAYIDANLPRPGGAAGARPPRAKPPQSQPPPAKE
jgi:hypothetical protein